MSFTPEQIECMTPSVRVEIADFYARRWLMLHTPVPRHTFPDTSPHDPYRNRDRRKCVREASAPKPEPSPWPKPWNLNRDPVEAELRRHERPPSKTPEAEHARYLRRREDMKAATSG